MRSHGEIPLDPASSRNGCVYICRYDKQRHLLNDGIVGIDIFIKGDEFRSCNSYLAIDITYKKTGAGHSNGQAKGTVKYKSRIAVFVSTVGLLLIGDGIRR